MSGRLVPWCSWEEWRWVRDGLYSGDAVAARPALDRVKAWETRQALPQAVLMTARLVEARLVDDDAAGSGGGAASGAALQLMYALAIVRSVNGLADSLQKGVTARSVSSAANQLGLPPWLVDMRHDAAHNDLPSLGTLRMGADHLLGWYHQNYWARQDTELGALAERLRGALAGYAAVAKRGGAPEDLRRAIEGVLQLLSESAWHMLLVPLLLEEPVAAALGAGEALGAAGLEEARWLELVTPLLLTLQSAFPALVTSVVWGCLERLHAELWARDGGEEARGSVGYWAGLAAFLSSQAFHLVLLRWEHALGGADEDGGGDALLAVLAAGLRPEERSFLRQAAVLGGDHAALHRGEPHRAAMRTRVEGLPDGEVKELLLAYLPQAGLEESAETEMAQVSSLEPVQRAQTVGEVPPPPAVSGGSGGSSGAMLDLEAMEALCQ
mmetsp:Transcript_8990/g.26133  ORF Transcript_8990/g.26133 Transcript_8990/m.26133 type:complete len:440 (-) Transcript_8990:1203-2522(-)